MSFSISVPEKATCFFGVVFDEWPHFVLSKTSECLVIVDGGIVHLVAAGGISSLTLHALSVLPLKKFFASFVSSNFGAATFLMRAVWLLLGQ